MHRIPLTPIRIAKTKKTIPRVCKNVEQLELHYTAVGNVYWYNHIGKVFMSRAEYRHPYDPIIPLLGVYTTEMEI